MVTFVPFGPWPIPVETLASKRLLVEEIGDFWEEHSEISSSVGCYVFGIRTGRAIVPYYVGLTCSTFEKECFTDHKLKHYHTAMANYKRGTPVMFFLAAPARRGRVNRKAIEELENFLIQAGMAVNEEMCNVRGRCKPKWAIKGVMRSGSGKRSDPATRFGKMMGIRDR